MKNSGLYSLLFGILVATCLKAHASALVWKDDGAKVIHVIARMHYAQKGLNHRELKRLSREATGEISRMWNEPHAAVLIDGVSYQLQFDVTTRTGPLILADHVLPYTFNQSCMDNFIDFLPKTHNDDRSFYLESDRFGVFYTSDDIGASTTAAHEFGHSIGLQHNPLDERKATVPGIMFARGTWVKPEFQYVPSLNFWQVGGTINPVYRHVRPEDVAAVHIEKLKFTEDGVACIGEGRLRKVPSNSVQDDGAP